MSELQRARTNFKKKYSHLQDEDLIFGSLADLPPVLLQELFTRVHLHRGSVLGSEYLTELLPERKNFTGFFTNRDLEGREVYFVLTLFATLTT